MTLTCHETTLQELPKLLEILLAHLPDELRQLRIDVMVRLYAKEYETLLAVQQKHQSSQNETQQEVFHWSRNGKIVGGLFAMPRPDKTLWSLLPAVVSGEPKSTMRRIFEKLNDVAIKTKMLSIMILADYQQSADETLLNEFGYEKLSELLNLNSQRIVFPETFSSSRLRFREYQNENWQEMVALVEKTYQNTLDFPQLCGLVPTHEILKGYQESHVFDPSLWFFVEDESQVIGALLLTQLEEKQHLELTYLGLTPEFRGKGLSHELVRFTQFLARRRNNDYVLVSVDKNNIPALNIYLHNGFHLHDQKEIFVRRNF